ncbi:MAG: NAD(P)/FAD-dependent oxidoreductase [Promethearchaeia archaeon]
MAEEMEEYKCEVLIIGAGPAGLTAAIYCGRADRDTIILQGKQESSLAKAKEISNWPGEPDIGGEELLDKFLTHAKSYDSVKVIKGDVISLMMGLGTNMISTRSANITSDVVIIATGMGQRKELIKGESNLVGYGVSYCALCDGPLYKEKDVYLYGDDKEVFEDALVLHQMGCHVNIITQQSMDELPEEKEELLEQNIPIMDNTEIIETISNKDNTLQKIICKDLEKEEQKDIELDALFIFSHVPSNQIFKKGGIILDENKNIKVNEDQETNIKGVYAAGDVTGGLFQVIFAAAEGAKAGINANKFLRSLEKKKEEKKTTLT